MFNLRRQWAAALCSTVYVTVIVLSKEQEARRKEREKRSKSLARINIFNLTSHTHVGSLVIPNSNKISWATLQVVMSTFNPLCERPNPQAHTRTHSKYYINSHQVPELLLCTTWFLCKITLHCVTRLKCCINDKKKELYVLGKIVFPFFSFSFCMEWVISNNLQNSLNTLCDQYLLAFF